VLLLHRHVGTPSRRPNVLCYRGFNARPLWFAFVDVVGKGDLVGLLCRSVSLHVEVSLFWKNDTRCASPVDQVLSKVPSSYIGTSFFSRRRLGGDPGKLGASILTSTPGSLIDGDHRSRDWFRDDIAVRPPGFCWEDFRFTKSLLITTRAASIPGVACRPCAFREAPVAKHARSASRSRGARYRLRRALICTVPILARFFSQVVKIRSQTFVFVHNSVEYLPQPGRIRLERNPSALRAFSTSFSMKVPALEGSPCRAVRRKCGDRGGENAVVVSGLEHQNYAEAVGSGVTATSTFLNCPLLGALRAVLNLFFE